MIRITPSDCSPFEKKRRSVNNLRGERDDRELCIHRLEHADSLCTKNNSYDNIAVAKTALSIIIRVMKYSSLY